MLLMDQCRMTQKTLFNKSNTTTQPMNQLLQENGTRHFYPLFRNPFTNAFTYPPSTAPVLNRTSNFFARFAKLRKMRRTVLTFTALGLSASSP